MKNNCFACVPVTEQLLIDNTGWKVSFQSMLIVMIFNVGSAANVKGASSRIDFNLLG